MTMDADREFRLVTPEQRRRNIVLGLALAGAAIAIVAVFMVQFTRHGLPKDPNVWKRLEQERSAAETTGESPIGGTTDATTVVDPAKAPATSADQQPAGKDPR